MDKFHATNKLSFVACSRFQHIHGSIVPGINRELVQVAGSPPTTYSSVDHYLQFMSHPYAYDTNLELIAATQFNGVQFRITYHTQPQQYLTPPTANVCDIINKPGSLHYATLR